MTCISIQYFVILLVLALILLSVGIALYAKRNQGDQYLRDGWTSANISSPSLLTSIELNFHCCGLDRVNDTLSAPCPVWTDPPCMPILESLFAKAITNAGACGIAFSIIMVRHNTQHREMACVWMICV